MNTEKEEKLPSMWSILGWILLAALIVGIVTDPLMHKRQSTKKAEISNDFGFFLFT